MRAIDANVVVRYLTRDDPGQAAKARAVVDAGNVFVGTTVLLETEWVLCSVYGFSSQDVADALLAFAGLPGVSVESPALLAGAISRTRNGMDFADALHLGAAVNCEEMLTFGRRFIEAAKGDAVRVTKP
ncbi:MAG: type II toxin-antitoxin system VapC family toxin [Boseongicola sp.]|nr:type II toxin-antitoxin system VapC family toxin [Boseongicola sp.]